MRPSHTDDRLSFPFIFDPNFKSRPQLVEGLPSAEDDHASRWDGASVYAFEGNSGDYILAKVGACFRNWVAAC